FDVESATQAYLNRLDSEQSAASDAYYEGGYWVNLWGFLYGLMVAWILLKFRISTKMRDLGERLGRIGFIWAIAYVMQYLVVVFVLSLPFVIYRDFVREHDYGLSNLTFMGWFNEQLIGLGVGLVLGGLGIALIYLLIRKLPKT
ncbi:MAG: M48 family peptidase, partial [Gammaproteobacteria bacterium]|nr:M48 family peptidase [Gammaproteobacteria bacterium]